MKVELKDNYCLVTRENSHKVYSESLLWYQIKQELIKQGYDVIKKLMYKDGHLVSEEEHYIRDRKWGWCLRDGYFAIRQMTLVFNNDKTLRLDRIYF